eukprot:TRINITY_DN25114_c0_g1_i2.p1 TRINITY_DN25114_c0_g1~~TRINITY_DN25114_c0_g1_i2.p1  ORF type:complete len:145 (+),score=4.12 TRINITY_DN25114_c0_g1_i2:298-732(+)
MKKACRGGLKAARPSGTGLPGPARVWSSKGNGHSHRPVIAARYVATISKRIHCTITVGVQRFKTYKNRSASRRSVAAGSKSLYQPQAPNAIATIPKFTMSPTAASPAMALGGIFAIMAWCMTTIRERRSVCGYRLREPRRRTTA